MVLYRLSFVQYLSFVPYLPFCVSFCVFECFNCLKKATSLVFYMCCQAFQLFFIGCPAFNACRYALFTASIYFQLFFSIGRSLFLSAASHGCFIGCHSCSTCRFCNTCRYACLKCVYRF